MPGECLAELMPTGLGSARHCPPWLPQLGDVWADGSPAFQKSFLRKQEHPKNVQPSLSEATIERLLSASSLSKGRAPSPPISVQFSQEVSEGLVAEYSTWGQIEEAEVVARLHALSYAGPNKPVPWQRAGRNPTLQQRSVSDGCTASLSCLNAGARVAMSPCPSSSDKFNPTLENLSHVLGHLETAPSSEAKSEPSIRSKSISRESSLSVERFDGQSHSHQGIALQDRETARLVEAFISGRPPLEAAQAQAQAQVQALSAHLYRSIRPTQVADSRGEMRPHTRGAATQPRLLQQSQQPQPQQLQRQPSTRQQYQQQQQQLDPMTSGVPDMAAFAGLQSLLLELQARQEAEGAEPDTWRTARTGADPQGRACRQDAVSPAHAKQLLVQQQQQQLMTMMTMMMSGKGPELLREARQQRQRGSPPRLHGKGAGAVSSEPAQGLLAGGSSEGPAAVAAHARAAGSEPLLLELLSSRVRQLCQRRREEEAESDVAWNRRETRRKSPLGKSWSLPETTGGGPAAAANGTAERHRLPHFYSSPPTPAALQGKGEGEGVGSAWRSMFSPHDQLLRSLQEQQQQEQQQQEPPQQQEEDVSAAVSAAAASAFRQRQQHQQQQEALVIALSQHQQQQQQQQQQQEALIAALSQQQQQQQKQQQRRLREQARASDSASTGAAAAAEEGKVTASLTSALLADVVWLSGSPRLVAPPAAAAATATTMAAAPTWGASQQLEKKDSCCSDERPALDLILRL